MRLDDPPAGQEAQIDFGLMGTVADADGKRRRLWALIVTLSSSRYMHVWPTFTQTVEDVCAGLDAAWRFFGGVPKHIILDNASSMVVRASKTDPTLNRAFRDYTEARGTLRRHGAGAGTRGTRRASRIRCRTCASGGSRARPSPPTSPRFVGTPRRGAATWPARACTGRRGRCRAKCTSATSGRTCSRRRRRRSTCLTGRSQRSTPITTCRCSRRCTRCRRATSARCSTRAPTARRCGCISATELIKVHPRKAAGGRSTDPKDFPPGKAPWALRDVDAVVRSAREQGAQVGAFAERLLGGPVPWIKLRQALRPAAPVRALRPGSRQRAVRPRARVRRDRRAAPRRHAQGRAAHRGRRRRHRPRDRAARALRPRRLGIRHATAVVDRRPDTPTSRTEVSDERAHRSAPSWSPRSSAFASAACCRRWPSDSPSPRRRTRRTRTCCCMLLVDEISRRDSTRRPVAPSRPAWIPTWCSSAGTSPRR